MSDTKNTAIMPLANPTNTKSSFELKEKRRDLGFIHTC
jgi:hypothetical protein